MSSRPVKCKACDRGIIAESRPSNRGVTIRIPSGNECKQVQGGVTIICPICHTVNLWHDKRLILIDL